MTITITEKSEINAQGTLNSKRCKPVVCINKANGHCKVYSSMFDAAQDLGVTQAMISCTASGKYSSCNGNTIFLVKDIPAHLEEIFATMNNLATKVNDLTEKANAYDAIVEQQTQKHKAKEEFEKRNAEVAKLEAKLHKAKALATEAEEKVRLYYGTTVEASSHAVAY